MMSTLVGSVVSLWRYPVKSMIGEELNASAVTERGLLGDRVYALVDASDGKVASAKNPRKWGKLFDFRANFIQPPAGEEMPPVRITLPDGTIVSSDQEEIDKILSNLLGREARLTAAAPQAPRLEEYWPEVDGVTPMGEPVASEYRETVTAVPMPPGLFFDYGVLHLLTTGTIDRLRELYPQGRFEVRRFRPNIVVQPASGEKDFVENAWIGHTLAIGDEVRLRIIDPCPRCVMTTLPQGDVPSDPGILRTIAKHNNVKSATFAPGEVFPAVAGVYAAVLQGGTVRRGDTVRLDQ
jgi:uncharacterized protein YcbX